MNGLDNNISNTRQYGTNAERLALSAGGIKPFSEFYETDTGTTYMWTGSWVVKPVPGAAITSVDLGVKADTAATDSTGSWSLIALIKRLVAKFDSALSVIIPLISGEDEVNNLLRVREVGSYRYAYSYGDGTGGTGSTPVGHVWKITRTEMFSGVASVSTFTYAANTMSTTGYAIATQSEFV